MNALTIMSPAKLQVSLRGLLVLTAAFAYWLWLLSPLWRLPLGFAIFTGITLVSGVGSHLVSTSVLPWRGTAVVCLVLGPLLLLGLPLYWLTGGATGYTILWMPLNFLKHQQGIHLVSGVLLLASVMGLTAAHLVRPGLLTAIISALGVSLRYGIAFLMAADAG